MYFLFVIVYLGCDCVLLICDCAFVIVYFLGPRGPFGTPSFVRSSVGKKNLDQLYCSINHHRTTANLSDIVWCMSGGVWWCLVVSGLCLVVSDACLVVSGGVNVYRLI